MGKSHIFYASDDNDANKKEEASFEWIGEGLKLKRTWHYE